MYKLRGKVNRRKFGVPMGGFMSQMLSVIAVSMVETKVEPGPDLTGGMVRYMDDVFGLYAVHTSSEEEQVNKYSERVATSYPPPPLVLNVEAKSNTLRFLQLVITIDADRLGCRLWNSVARNTGSGDTVLLNETSDAGRRYQQGGETVLGCWCHLQDHPGMIW